MRTLKMREAGEMGNEVRRGWAGSTIDKRLVFRSSLYEKKLFFLRIFVKWEIYFDRLSI